MRRYRLLVHDRAHLNAVLDRLRARGVEIEALQPLRQSLEDYFVEVVQEAAPAVPLEPAPLEDG